MMIFGLDYSRNDYYSRYHHYVIDNSDKAYDEGYKDGYEDGTRRRQE